MNCIFCDIVAGSSPSRTVFEDDRVVIFKDIHPKARTHLLVTPKKHFSTFLDTPTEEVAYLLKISRKLADKLKVANGFRLQINNGPQGGQIVYHLHVHFMTNLVEVGDEKIEL